MTVPFAPGPASPYQVMLTFCEFFKNRNVEIHRFFGMVVEPQEWRDFLHDR